MTVAHTLRHFEHGLPYFPDLDINTLLGAWGKFEWIKTKTKEQETAKAEAEEKGVAFVPDPVDPNLIAETFKEVLAVLAKAGRLRTIRYLAAVATASEDDLREAETNPKKWEDLQDAAAHLPIKEALETALGFHMELLSSLGVSAGSSQPQKAAPQAKTKKSARPGKGGSRSED